MPLDYSFTQKYINFGRQLAGNIVGQPFGQYRLNALSAGNVIAQENLITDDIRAKVTSTRQRTELENDELHENIFEFMLDSSAVNIFDILVQNDTEFGGDTAYCVCSKRPLKKTLAIRVDRQCKIFRPNTRQSRDPNYSGYTKGDSKPFVLIDGQFTIGDTFDTNVATLIPCGITYIGQIKTSKPDHLPMAAQTNWWYVYIPTYPGLTRLRENDYIEVQYDENENPVRFKIHAPYLSPAGLQGCFALCERVTP